MNTNYFRYFSFSLIAISFFSLTGCGNSVENDANELIKLSCEIRKPNKSPKDFAKYDEDARALTKKFKAKNPSPADQQKFDKLFSDSVKSGTGC